MTDTPDVPKLAPGTAVEFVTDEEGLWKKGDHGKVIAFVISNGPGKSLHAVDLPENGNVPANYDSEIVEV